jgi:uncharacterized protein YbaR (Trm112 family)
MGKLVRFAVFVAIAAGIVVAIMKFLERRDEPLPIPGRGGMDDFEPQSYDESELGGEVSDELLAILVCPEDKGPLKLSDDGKWLINPRNGYRYPIRRGIPVMLIEEGRKNRDESLIEQPNS